jgi:hypothetical protein
MVVSHALTAPIITDIKHRMVTRRHEHAKAKKSPIKGPEDLRTL